MAHVSLIPLPLDSDGVCMVCKTTPSEETTLTCVTCATPWHVACLKSLPETLAFALKFECPDCSGEGGGAPVAEGAPTVVGGAEGELMRRVREIEADSGLSEAEKAKRRQELLGGKGKAKMEDEDEEGEEKEYDVLKVLHESFKCCFCMQLPERPVTTPCGHNFCLKCFEKWIRQGKNSCAKCRSHIPPAMATRPRINLALVDSIRLAKMSRSITSGSCQTAFFLTQNLNQDRPDTAYTTERAKKPGKANAKCGRIFVTVPDDHFGPIPAENDPERMQGVLVGESWPDRLTCAQWGVHRPPVAGIAGQSEYGAQSIALSGGYEDDQDHGEWFLYTGSGGRDLQGNKRTNKEQSKDQEFTLANQALRVSCMKGYPIRVLRSCKEKRSVYAPLEGNRYDGIYRIEKCWRKVGIQGFKVCRYLFIRCDNAPAPWTSDENGDQPRPLPDIPELEDAENVCEREESPSWDFDEEEAVWKWRKAPPRSKKKVVQVNPEDLQRTRVTIRKVQYVSAKEKLLNGFTCLLCHEVLTLPLTTPCAHNFCKCCLEKAFAGQSSTKERTCHNGRKLRAQKIVLKCPTCDYDISEFLQNPQVNREIMGVIEKLRESIAKDKMERAAEEAMLTSETIPESSKTDVNIPKESTDLAGSKRKETDPSLNGQESKKIKYDKANGSSKDIGTSEGVQGGIVEGNNSPSSPLQMEPENDLLCVTN
ncbi:hypothetical protein Leryth_024640 [Lithospermum erythrorhizon]|nr:hypothetical protein Leryth_024640 [Lithospermum erythrorhizon]